MTEILLTRGQVSIVDDVDAQLVQQFSWRAAPASNGKGWYARTIVYVRGSGRANPMKVSLSIHELLLGTPGGDHRNGNGLDNRRENLRRCAQRQNTWNTRKRWRPASSRFKGVSRRASGRWAAYIRVNCRRQHLGFFGSEEDAARAYNVAARESFGEFARLNDLEAA